MEKFVVCGWTLVIAAVVTWLYGCAIAKKVPHGPDPRMHKRIRTVFGVLCGIVALCGGALLQLSGGPPDSRFAKRTFREWKGRANVDLKNGALVLEGLPVPFRFHELAKGELGYVATTEPVADDQVVVDCVMVFNTDEEGKNRILVGVPDVQRLGGVFTTKLAGEN